MRATISRAAAIIAGGLLMIFFLSACASTAQPAPAAPTAGPAPTAAVGDAAPELAAAQTALERFLNALADGDYATAASLYGGDYEVLRGYNPPIAPDDHAALLEAACTANGFMCLRPTSMYVAGDNPSGLTFAVSFANSDGSTFVFTPPPGSPDQPRSSFPLRVVTGPEGPKVVDLPPYVS